MRRKTTTTRTATEITQTGYSTKTSSDRSIFVSYGTPAMNLCASLGIFMRQGRGMQR